MKRRNPIVIIDDDEDDIALIKEAVLSLEIHNEIIAFTDARQALVYFRESLQSPFFIMCDVNMPAMDGFEFREKIYGDNFLKLRTTPFIFLTTSQLEQSVNKAYVMNIQGYFTKPSSFDGFVEMFRSIVSYWSISVAPTT